MGKKKSFSGLQSYSMTKRHQRYLPEIWSKKFSDKGVLFWSMHPGWSKTPGTNALPKWFDQEKFRTSEEGADTIVWLAASDVATTKIPTGSFVFDREIVPGDLTSGTESSSEDIEKLYQYCAKFKEPINLN